MSIYVQYNRDSSLSVEEFEIFENASSRHRCLTQEDFKSIIDQAVHQLFLREGHYFLVNYRTPVSFEARIIVNNVRLADFKVTYYSKKPFTLADVSFIRSCIEYPSESLSAERAEDRVHTIAVN